MSTKIALTLIGAICFPLSFAQNGHWRVYNTINSELPENSILSIGLDEIGNKWLGTAWGLVRYDDYNWTTYPKKTKKGIMSSTARSITIDAKGGLWVGTLGDGMSQLTFTEGNPDDPDAPFRWIHYHKKNSGLPDDRVKTIVIDTTGAKWIGTDNGMILMKGLDWGEGGIKWTEFNSSNSGMPHDAVNTIAIDTLNNKWIGTFGGGLAKYDDNNWTVYNIRNSGLPDNYIISMIIDHKQTLWVATYTGGLASFDGRSWKEYTTSNSGIPDHAVYSMAVDDQNNLWVGTLNSGLAKFDGTKWTSFDLMNSGQPYTVSCIAIDKKGNKWLGTGGGLAVFNENGVK